MVGQKRAASITARRLLTIHSCPALYYGTAIRAAVRTGHPAYHAPNCTMKTLAKLHQGFGGKTT